MHLFIHYVSIYLYFYCFEYPLLTKNIALSWAVIWTDGILRSITQIMVIRAAGQSLSWPFLCSFRPLSWGLWWLCHKSGHWSMITSHLQLLKNSLSRPHIFTAARCLLAVVAWDEESSVSTTCKNEMQLHGWEGRAVTVLEIGLTSTRYKPTTIQVYYRACLVKVSLSCIILSKLNSLSFTSTGLGWVG